jgi:NAD(P)-dependent dehydrogenase (short-subunit alcohol dehydrogenase family)
MREVSGKTAFITGGASGIGLAMAQVFLEAGMRVVVADLLKSHLAEAASHLQAHSRATHYITLDVRERAAFARAADEAERVFGKVHVLCNNAGVGSDRPVMDAPYEEWDWIFGVNVGGVINGLVTFMPRMRASGEEAHIVNTASLAALIPLGATAIYTGTKFAVRGLSEALRVALAPHRIGVSVLCPGLVRSRIFESARYRPAHVPAPAPGPNLGDALMTQFGAAAVEPVEVGRAVLRGIRNNDAYILTHPESKAEVAELCGELLAAFPPAAGVSEARMQLESHMRAMRTAERTAAHGAANEHREE